MDGEVRQRERVLTDVFGHQNSTYFAAAGFAQCCFEPIGKINWQDQGQHDVLRE